MQHNATSMLPVAHVQKMALASACWRYDAARWCTCAAIPYLRGIEHTESTCSRTSETDTTENAVCVSAPLLRFDCVLLGDGKMLQICSVTRLRRFVQNDWRFARHPTAIAR
eukprot:12167660-Heterocapsa_arctica.AAC.1